MINYHLLTPYIYMAIFGALCGIFGLVGNWYYRNLLFNH